MTSPTALRQDFALRHRQADHGDRAADVNFMEAGKSANCGVAAAACVRATGARLRAREITRRQAASSPWQRRGSRYEEESCYSRRCEPTVRAKARPDDRLRARNPTIPLGHGWMLRCASIMRPRGYARGPPRRNSMTTASRPPRLKVSPICSHDDVGGPTDEATSARTSRGARGRINFIDTATPTTRAIPSSGRTRHFNRRPNW